MYKTGETITPTISDKSMEQRQAQKLIYTYMFNWLSMKVERQFKGEISLSNKWCGNNWIATCKKKKKADIHTLHLYKNKLKIDNTQKCKT